MNPFGKENNFKYSNTIRIGNQITCLIRLKIKLKKWKSIKTNIINLYQSMEHMWQQLKTDHYLVLLTFFEYIGFRYFPSLIMNNLL